MLSMQDAADEPFLDRKHRRGEMQTAHWQSASIDGINLYILVQMHHNSPPLILFFFLIVICQKPWTL